MRYVVCLLVVAFAATASFAQEIPARFNALTKNAQFRLQRVLGDPELPMAFDPLSSYSADGKRLISAEDLSLAPEGKPDQKAPGDPQLRTRLLLWDLPAKSWPREIELAGKRVTALH